MPEGAFITLKQNPVLLPPPLATLIERQIATLKPPSALSLMTDESTLAFLLPGRPPSRPRNPDGLAQRLKEVGLPTITARHTAMIGIVADLPPAVISDLFGIHRNTVNVWAGFAQDSWADYLAACQATE